MARRHAERAIGRGIARWRGGLIEFIEDDYRNIAALESVKATRRPWVEGGGSMARLDQIEGLPCAGDAVRLIMGRRATA